jgi:hypothetical protein
MPFISTQTSSSAAPAMTALAAGVTRVQDTCSPSIAKVVSAGCGTFQLGDAMGVGSVPRTLMLINGALVKSARAELRHGGNFDNFCWLIVRLL